MHNQTRREGLTSESAAVIRQRAASVSLIYNVLFTLAKVIAAVWTGSISLLSEAIHSGTDVVASFIAFVSVRAAAVPPDEEHPYGHGKIESLAGFGESILLFLIVLYLIGEGVHRIITRAELHHLEVGIAVIFLSTVSSLITARYVLGVAKHTHSLALLSNGQHLLVDFYTSAGVLVSLMVVHFTGWTLIDPLLAIGIALWLTRGAWNLSRQAFHQLIDTRLPDEEVHKIDEILRADPRVISYHRLRTRRSGYVRYVDLHLVVPNHWSVQQAHDVADDLEKKIECALAPAHAVIHVDPYDSGKDARNQN